SKKLLVAVSLAASTIAGPLFAQSAGNVRGTISDPSGAVLNAASVSLTNEATKFTRTGQTDSRGTYYFASVDPGTYTIKAELSGFKVHELKGVRVGANDNLNVP